MPVTRYGPKLPKPPPLPPFNNPATDIILRSSDGMDLHVHSVILVEASPIFADMLSIRRLVRNASQGSSGQSSGGKAVVELAETSEPLDHLLRLCYPVRDPALHTPEDIQPVLRAALKYEMDAATATMRKRLSALVASEPLEVWAVACSVGLEELAQQAAKLVKKPIPGEKLPGVFKEVTAGAYFRLIKVYRIHGRVPSTFKFCEPSPEHAKQGLGPKGPHYSTASPKFTERPFVDLVCRAADGVEFRTHKIILAASSPSLRQRILRLPATGISDGDLTLPVLALDSSSEDLETILELLYPGSVSVHAKANALHLPPGRLLQLAQCARKYKISFVDDAILTQWIKTASYEPMLAFLLATRLGLTRYCQVAEKALQRKPRSNDHWVPEMESMPASAYHTARRLFQTSVFSDSDDDIFGEYDDKFKRDDINDYSSDPYNDVLTSDDDVLLLPPRKRRAL
ncbi:hypothetical protein BD311DRAFT_683093 [Dichomitus squalens]|uniref:BTB domain-containing protein n=1 Tax=Dichomitus squalens TaxID=114155 RepID=A0A4Q9N4L3_9APHY|nr:hypothetical protein BD311DRAFT_683093 [Dichomitus squalens]